MLDWLAGRFSLIKDVMAKNEFVSGRLKNDGKNLNLYMTNGNNLKFNSIFRSVQSLFLLFNTDTNSIIYIYLV